MAYLLGSLVGGVVAVYLFSLLLEWAIFKRVSDSALVGIPASVITAAVLGVILYGFGNAHGGSWNPYPGGIGYMVGGFIVLPLRLRSYHKKRESEGPDADLQETFE